MKCNQKITVYDIACGCDSDMSLLQMKEVRTPSPLVEHRLCIARGNRFEPFALQTTYFS
jgi:hypothetical protein